MQGKIRIEHLPKLDKILRVTFVAIRKDLNEVKEDFSSLQDDVNSFTDDFKTKLNKTSSSISSEVDKKITDVDNRFSKKALNIEDQIISLGNSFDLFIKKSNAKTKEVNDYFKRLDNFYAISQELNKEIKNLKFLKGEISKIESLSKNIDVIENSAVMKVELDKRLSKIYKRIDSKMLDIDTDKDIFVKKMEQEFDNEKKSLINKIKALEKTIEYYNKENKSQIGKVKQWHENSKQNLNDKSKDFEEKSKILLNKFDNETKELKNHVISETSTIKSNVAISSSELKGFIEKETIKNRSDVEEIKDEQLKIIKNFSYLVKEKDFNKTLNEYTSLKRFNEIRDELNKEVKARTQLENDIKLIKLEFSKINKNNSIFSEKKVKEDKKIINKEKDRNKVGFFQKILNFLIEEVEDDNDKDKRLQEFDRKKGEKFEIKEIKELK